ncbi:MAG: hypothetical protein M1596_05390 [Firmicutes bacterium]|nr:hypothetical protein [Bacillota bacterium]
MASTAHHVSRKGGNNTPYKRPATPLRLALGKLTYSGVTDVLVARQEFFQVIQAKAPEVVKGLEKCLPSYQAYAAYPFVYRLLPQGGFEWEPVPPIPGTRLLWEDLAKAVTTEAQWNQIKDLPQYAFLANRATLRAQKFMAKQRFFDALQQNHQQAQKDEALLRAHQLSDHDFLTHWGTSFSPDHHRLSYLHTAINQWSTTYHLEDSWIKESALTLLARWSQKSSYEWKYPAGIHSQNETLVVMQPGIKDLMRDAATTLIGDTIEEGWIDAHGGLKPIKSSLPEPQPEEGESPETWQRRITEYVAAGFTFVPESPRLDPPESPQLHWDPTAQDDADWVDAKATYRAAVAEYIKQYHEWALNNAGSQGWIKPTTKRDRSEFPQAHFEWLVDYQIRGMSFKTIADQTSSPAGNAVQYTPSNIGKAVRTTARLLRLTLRK